MDTNLELLGFTKEELQERVIETMCDRLLAGTAIDEDGTPYTEDSEFKRKLDKAIHTHIDGAIAKLAETHVLPQIVNMVETITLQQTNRWGEKRGEALSFVEYLTKRADLYLREETDYEGYTKEERRDSYGWKAAGTRVSCLINKHLQYAIQVAMAEALKNANHAIVGGLEQAVKIKLGEVAAALKVEIKTR